MNKYIIVTTFCNNEEVVNKIIDTLLSKKLIASSQVSKVHSKYWWKEEINSDDEYKLEFRTKDSLFNEIKSEIESIHDYDIPEISCYEITNGNDEFFKWIDQNTKQEL